LIPNARPSVGVEELSEIRKVFATGWLGMGSVVFDFEKALANYLGAKFVVAVNTGTSALHIALSALELGPKDEVIVPSLTFAASIQAIIAAGARPVFCDVDADTLNLDLNDALKKITPRTKAIMPVHYSGLSCDMDGLMDISRSRKIRIVEDAAHAIGSLYKGKKIGSIGDITCFSFDPIKNLTCGEGGAVVLSDEPLYQEILRKRILGIDKDTWQRYKNQRSWFYEVVTPGFRYHMSNINAAIGLVQLKKLDQVIAKKIELVKAYDQAFNKVEQIELLRRDYTSTAFFNYIVRIKGGARDALLEYLNAHGVGAGIHYIPNHLQPLFKKFSAKVPVTDRVWKEIISLPLYFDMTSLEQSEVINKVCAFFIKQ